MIMFQYITINSKGQSEEIWVCENCRKKNSIQILRTNWRLIDKCENANFECGICHARQTEREHQIFSDNQLENKTPLL